MFVIKSDQLKKNLNIEDEDIIGDLKTLQVGHEVQFFYKEKVRKGCIIKYIESKIKRTKKLKRSYSPSDYEKSELSKSKKKCDLEKKSKISAKIVNSSMSESSDNDDGKAERVENISEDFVDEQRNGKELDGTKNISPKNDLPLEEIKTEVKNDSKPNDNSASPSGVQHLGLDDDDHLYGESSDNMILLREGIYVKKIILDTALRTASKVLI